MKNNSGFTLLEVMVTTLVLVVAIATSLSIFTYSLALTESVKQLTNAQYQVERQVEQIRAMDYLDVRNNFTNNGALRSTVMAITNNQNLSGTIYANELPGAANNLLRVKVVVCYAQRKRIMGEDANFNGVLDAGEDANGNGELDSPCQLETVVFGE